MAAPQWTDSDAGQPSNVSAYTSYSLALQLWGGDKGVIALEPPLLKLIGART